MPDIIKTMELLNYSPDRQGVCFGIAALASQAALRKDAITFANRMDFIRNSSEEDIKTLGKSIKYINTLKNKKEILSKRLDLLSFFDELSIYQGIDSVNLEFKVIVPTQQDLSIFRKKIAPEENDPFSGVTSNAAGELSNQITPQISNIDIHSGKMPSEKGDKYIYPEVKINIINLFTYDQLRNLIIELKKHLNNEPFSIMMSSFISALHATQIGFDGTNWISSDHDEIILESDTPDTLEGLDNALQNNTIFNEYYDDLSEMVASLNIVLPEKCEANLSKFKEYDFSLDEINPNSDQEMLLHLITFSELTSRYDLMTDILDKIKLLNLTHHAQINFLKLIQDDTLSIIVWLAGKGEHGMLNKISEVMTELGFDTETKIDVFNKKNHNSLSPLFLAAQEGHKETVQFLLAWIERIEDERLRGDMLNAERGDGISAFSMTAENGHEGVTNLMLNAFNAIENEAIKADLIAAKGDDGIPILLMCASKGHENIVSALLKAACSIKDDKRRGDLLRGEMSNGTTALNMAVQHRRIAIVNSMLKAFLETKLPEDVLFNLFAGENSEGITALLIAVQNNDIDMVKIITEYIMKSSLSATKKAKLITAAVPSYTVSAYDYAISEGYTKISKYLENTVLNYDTFTSKMKMKILQSLKRRRV